MDKEGSLCLESECRQGTENIVSSFTKKDGEQHDQCGEY